jgi:hypothetical protein
MAAPGIFCLETDWGDRLADRLSVEPQLRMLESSPHCGQVVRRDAGTRAEFERYLSLWLHRRYQAIPLAYLAFHGSPAVIWVGEDRITLEEFGDLLSPRRAVGRTIYFGSCETLKADPRTLQRFCRLSGAKAIVGYTKSVDWFESAAFDLLMLPDLLNRASTRATHRRLATRYGDPPAPRAWPHGGYGGLGRARPRHEAE